MNQTYDKFTNHSKYFIEDDWKLWFVGEPPAGSQEERPDLEPCYDIMNYMLCADRDCKYEFKRDPENPAHPIMHYAWVTDSNLDYGRYPVPCNYD